MNEYFMGIDWEDPVADLDGFLGFREKPPFKFSSVEVYIHKHYCIDNLS